MISAATRTACHAAIWRWLRLPVAWMPVTVVDATCAHPTAVGDIQLQLLPDLLALEGIPNPEWDPGQVDLLHPVAGPL
jgi:hypothetical protein